VRERRQRVAEGARIGRVHEHAAAAHDLGQGGRAHGDHGQAVAHRLRHRDAERLEGGVTREDIGGGEVARQLATRDIAGEPHVLVHAELGGERPQRALLRPRAAHDEPHRASGVEAPAQREQQRVHALLRRQPLQREDDALLRLDAEAAAHGGAVPGRSGDVDAVVDHVAAPGAGAVHGVTAIPGHVRGAADRGEQRALPPAPERRHAGARHVAAVEGEDGGHAERALGDDTGEARRHQVVHVHDVGTPPPDRVAQGGDGGQREGRQRAGRPAMTGHAHERHAVGVALHGKVHQGVVLVGAEGAHDLGVQHGGDQPHLVPARDAPVHLEDHELRTAHHGQKRGREHEDLHEVPPMRGRRTLS
jgi:hypothetical protein